VKSGDKPALPTIERDPTQLPPRVAAMRTAILEAAKSGDPDRLRVVAQRNELPPLFVKGQKGDPIEGLKSRSGDGKGLETLGILADVLDAGYVKTGTGESARYIWPWFAEAKPKDLTPAQLVEVYRVLRASEFKASLDADKYVGWRLAVSGDGTWQYFWTGE
jgi:hypothetical protein